MSLDGTNDYISVAHNSTLTFGAPSNPFTAAAFVKTTGVNGPILSKSIPTALTHQDYNLRVSSTGRLSLSRWHQSPDLGESVSDNDGPIINDGSWHHVAFVNENASLHKLYVDGVLVETSTATWIYNDSNTQPFYVGKEQNYTYTTIYLSEEIDDVRIYNAALDATAIAQLAAQ